MHQMTDSARSALEAFLARARRSLEGSGADVDEVISDLRRHVEEEIAARKITMVTEQEMRQIIARVGIPEPVPQGAALGSGEEWREPPRPQTTPPPLQRTAPAPQPGLVLLLLGVIIPFATLAFELLTGSCAGIFFDPMPTVGHILLVALVPTINLLVWHRLRQENFANIQALDWASGLSIGISIVYALLFLPLTPFAVIAVFVGIGVAALAPLLALIASIRLRSHLAKAAPAGSVRHGWLRAGAGMLLVLLLALPMALTDLALNWANSESPARQTRGIRLLRFAGEEEQLLRACYGRGGRSSGLYAWRTYVNPENARAIYYRVYGRAFNTVPPPKLYAGANRWSLIEDEFTWDNDQGGDAVAGRVKGLSLVNSRQDAMIDPAAALAYCEWTVEFKNDSRRQREARAQIQLPPGAVVSRVTLWIDGEEREAAFAGRSQVKAAYKVVVQQRRDPVLVTTCGPDRILMQCFPVPPGGKMKTRIGVTMPLVMDPSAHAFFVWPRFVERNFTLGEDFQHSVWAQSSGQMDVAKGRLVTETTAEGKQAVRGEVTDRDLSGTSLVLKIHRPADSTSCWTTDTRNPGFMVAQRVLETPVLAPSRVVMVIDGTENMAPHRDQIADALKSLPPGIGLQVLGAQDGVVELSDISKTDGDDLRSTAARKIRSFRYRGGHDNVPALLKACDLAAGASTTAVIWVHGPQPVEFESKEKLRQRLERMARPPLFLDVPATFGPDRMAEALDGIPCVSTIPRLGTLQADLERLFKGWADNTRHLVLTRESISASSFEPKGKETSLHLARLWAADEVGRLIKARQAQSAMRIAATYQLVTPVSGAVVLENQAQYAAAGLEPVAGDTVPMIPEPRSILLLLLGLVALLAWARRRHHTAGCQTA